MIHYFQWLWSNQQSRYRSTMHSTPHSALPSPLGCSLPSTCLQSNLYTRIMYPNHRHHTLGIHNTMLRIALFMIVCLSLLYTSSIRAQSFIPQLPIIEKIEIIGTKRSEPIVVRNMIQQSINEPLRAHVIQEDIKRIFTLGFYKDIQVHFKEIDGVNVLQYQVVEKKSIREIRYEGNDELSEDDFKEVVNLRAFSILDLYEVKVNANKIKDLYIEKGFFLAEVSWDIIQVEDHQVDVVFRILEKDEIRVEQIQIIGNSNLSAEEIKKNMETREESFMSFLSGAGTFKSEALERDQMRITQLYYTYGYMKALVTKPNVAMSPDRSKLYITIRVEEGARFKVGLVDVIGDVVIPRKKPKKDLKLRKKILKILNMKEGEWFSATKLRNAMTRVGDLYKDEGYAYVNLLPDTQFLPDQVIDLNFNIQKGPKVYIGRIDIVGNETTRDKVIRREMRIYEGDLYSSSKIKRSKQLIQRLGFFETVDITPTRSQMSNRINLRVVVKEKPTGTFQVGAGYSSIEKLVGQAQISKNNLFGRGQSLSLQATFSSLRNMANVRFSDNYLLDSRIQFAINLYRFDNNFINFTRQSLGGNLTFGYPLTDDIGVSLTYTLEEVSARAGGFNTSAVASSIVPANYFNNGITSSMRLNVFYDTRNNRIFPSKGMFANASVEEASEYLGSSNLFTRYNARYRYYFDLGKNIVFKTNLNWSYVLSRSVAGVPIFERFFVGGPLSIRGFFRNSLGPDIDIPSNLLPSAPTTSFVIGGTEQIFSNFELEFPIFQEIGIRGVGFVDAGNAFNRQDSYAEKLDQFRFAWGLGVRWFSPIGPLRFEWGYPFEPRLGEQNSVFEFSIGNFF